MLQQWHLHTIHPPKGLIDIKEQIRNFAKQLNIEYTGFTKEGDCSLIVFLFPYYTNLKENANISLYCRSLDYHLIIKNYLDKISEFILKEFDVKCESFVDVNPINEVDAAVRCNLGVKGKNRLLINDKYGSFVFIGILKTPDFIEPDTYENKECLGCNRCINSCPALKNNDFNLCVSEISQKKGTLTKQEEKLLTENKSVFGCDKCQIVCPMNNMEKTPIPEFYENRIYNLKTEMFEKLSNKEFKNLYGNRAFAWRGKNVLLRNLKLLGEENSQQE